MYIIVASRCNVPCKCHWATFGIAWMRETSQVSRFPHPTAQREPKSLLSRSWWSQKIFNREGVQGTYLFETQGSPTKRTPLPQICHLPSDKYEPAPGNKPGWAGWASNDQRDPAPSSLSQNGTRTKYKPQPPIDTATVSLHHVVVSRNIASVKVPPPYRPKGT